MNPDNEDAPGLAQMNDGKNCMSCRNSNGAPPVTGRPFLSGKCRSCILKASTGSMFPGWEPKSED